MDGLGDTEQQQTLLVAKSLLLFWALVAASSGLGSQTTADEVAFAAVRSALNQGRYATAEEAARTLRETVESRDRPLAASLAQSLDLLVEALVLNGRASSQETAAVAERAIRLRERPGTDGRSLAIALRNKGDVDAERGEFAEALALHERALGLRLRELGADSSEAAESLERVAFTLIRLERFADARQRLERAMTIRESRQKELPVEFSRTLALVALLNRYSGNYAAGASLADRVLTSQRSFDPDHPEVASTLHLRGDLFWLQGALADAQRAWQDALDLGQRTLRAGHPQIALFLRKLALAADTLGDRAEGRRLLREARETGEQSLAPCHPEFGWLLNDAARSAMNDGEFTDSRALHERTISVMEKCLGGAHANVATTLHNEALLAKRMGDFDDAERLEQRALRIWRTTLGPNHPYTARGLDTLARIVAARGQNDAARALFAQALDIRTKALGPEHPDVASTLLLFAETVAAAGDTPLALIQLQEASRILERAGPSDRIDAFGQVMALRGELEAKRGNAKAARACLTEAVALYRRTYGDAHPVVAKAVHGLAAFEFQVGEHPEAMKNALDAERIGREHLRLTVRYLPERQALAYAVVRPRGLDLALSIVAAAPDHDPSPVFQAVVESRGIVLDELAARTRSSSSPDPEVASLYATMLAARERFANLVYRSAVDPAAVSRRILDAARTAKEESERAVAARSAIVRADLERETPHVFEIGRALPPGTALVSFVRYDRPPLLTNAAKPVAPESSYIAFVTRSGSDTVATVPLGDAASLDRLIATWRAEAGGRSLARLGAARAETAYRAAALTLRERTWDIVAPHVSGATRVFIVPDGALNLVSFAALPAGATEYMVESGPTFHYLSAERDILAEPPSRQSGGLLAFGGAAFDDATIFAGSQKGAVPVGTAAQSTTAGALRATSGCGAFQSLRFGQLPGTRAEASEVAALWNAAPGSGAESAGSEFLSGRGASERAFKERSRGRRVLHLATHGFFLGGPCDRTGASTRAVGGIVTQGSTELPAAAVENPLLLSGLALAGANQRLKAGTGSDDGIVTAEEIAAMNLSGTEWAVLSACDTGLGEVRNGEGVLGLRRAFHVAGVRTVIMSLWSVEDRSTQQWMRGLYKARLEGNADTADSVRTASVDVLADRRGRGLSTHPFYWAAFVAAGDWR